MQFNLSTNLSIFCKKWYSRIDFLRMISYWEHWLNSTVDKSTAAPIGVIPGELTISSLAFFLALYKTKTSFAYLNDFTDYSQPNILHSLNVQFIVLMGESNDSLNRSIKFKTDNFAHGYAASAWKTAADDTVEFSKNYGIRLNTSGTTGFRKEFWIKSDAEGRSIQASMDNFFSVDDICLFSHNMMHKGVHTTAIFPALFKAKALILTSATGWPTLVKEATHCQWFHTMKDWYPLSKNIKTITTGGSRLDDFTIDFIQQSCPTATIYDIYGLTESLPPVAYRTITRNFKTDFVICRNDLNLYLDNEELCIVDSNNKTISTGDKVKFSNNKSFQYIERLKAQARMNGELASLTQIQSKLAEDLGNFEFSLTIKSGCVIIQTISAYDKIDTWCKLNQIDNYQIQVVENLTTNGGIKNVVGND